MRLPQFAGLLEVKLTLCDRISKLEFLDEIEELELVLSHYAISWGSTGSEEPLLSLTPKQP